MLLSSYPCTQADDMFELARVAEEYGSGEIRLTVEQNVIIPNVTTAKAALLLSDPLLLRLSPHPGNLMGSVVACTGSQFCGQAIIETKERARKVRLEGTNQLHDSCVAAACVIPCAMWDHCVCVCVRACVRACVSQIQCA